MRPATGLRLGTGDLLRHHAPLAETEIGRCCLAGSTEIRHEEAVVSLLNHVPAAPPVSVLVVDDEDVVRHLICRELWAQGYRTLEARSGEDALHLLDLAGSHVDLVITDVVMPGMHGGELGRRLLERRPNLPILYISAYDPKDIFHRGSPYTAAPFLRKPFSPEALMAAVGRLLADRLQHQG